MTASQARVSHCIATDMQRAKDKQREAQRWQASGHRAFMSAALEARDKALTTAKQRRTYLALI